MNIKGVQITPEPVVGKTSRGSKPKTGNSATDSFQDILFRELANNEQIKVSAHARKRMQERNINLGSDDWHKINDAINRAGDKGANNSLLIHGELALVVSVKNRTVVSAMDEKSIKEHVFTNIDSAVITK
ncbi:flagellar operon protein [Desulfotomaculum arcticum]|uniref:Flagellar operon protein n=1 Tax=Desulfotruncus arcticus DSM 17038 TaxID=1121424 RepID=A0A1I2MX00_9FIRM|nr:TIGR02530 family flagellar biosynthesis protein [Desulfotruncus arcticus]SFF95963.1 flagellar operon protein [Desulfotomaculum arcticum] [Desulfotruncus arcticus DSM 17038]